MPLGDNIQMYFLRYPTASDSYRRFFFQYRRFFDIGIQTYNDLEALCFDIEGASILILAGPAHAGLQQLQAAVQ
jgi:hypothetical protein